MKRNLYRLMFYILVHSFTLNSSAQTGRIGINTTTPAAMLHVKDSSVLFSGQFTGTPGNPPVTGAGTRMMWYPDKAAFRVGGVTGTQWDKNNIGDHSFATGYSSIASGQRSIAMGFAPQAHGTYSIAFGNQSIANGFSSMAFGRIAIASGDVSTALGSQVVARSYGSVAIGWLNDSIITSSTNTWVDTDPLFIIGNGASDINRSNALIILKNAKTGINTSSPQAMLHVKDSSVVFTGSSTSIPVVPGDPPVSGPGVRMMWYPDKGAFRAGGAGSSGTSWNKDNIGDFSFACGFATEAFGQTSMASGSITRASGNYSFAAGFATTARASNSVSIGRYNDSIASSSPTSWVLSDPLFIIGNGLNNISPSNALTVLKNAKTGINTSSPDAMLHIVSNGASGGGYNSNSAMIIESNTDAYIQLSNPSPDESGILSGSNVSNLRSGIVFRADSAISFRAGGNDTKMLLSKVGDVTIDGEINRPATGTAHLTPICYGSVASNAVINSGTSNFSISNSATGQYDVTITGETYTNSGYVTTITVVGGSNFRVATTGSAGGQIIIRIFDITGALVNTAFHFVVYKQ